MEQRKKYGYWKTKNILKNEKGCFDLQTLDEVDEIEERLTSEAVRWKRLYMELKKGVDKENAMMQAAVSG